MIVQETWQLLRDPPGDGAWNMAVDESLLESAAEGGTCVWRFYRWRRPTVSLGYFQRYDDRGQHPASAACPVVRRLTGGGAIVHDTDLTYSLVVPGDHRLAARRNALYDAIHGSLVEALAELGIAAGLASSRRSPIRGAEEPFLCFHRRTPGDVLLAGVKIAGSAQRRRRQAVLQHGSVLLRRSPAAPELPGMEDVAGSQVPDGELAESWLGALARWLAVAWCGGPLAQGQHQRAAVLAATRYTDPQWTENRVPRLSAARSTNPQ